MKHLLNNLTSEEKNRILEQYSDSLLVETNKFKNLINVKSGNVRPLLNEQTPTQKQPIQNPIQKTVVTQTTTLSPEQQKQQQLQQEKAKAQAFITEKFKIGKTLPLFDKENDTKPIGVYKVLGQIHENQSDLTEINPNNITQSGQLTFMVEAISQTDGRKKNLTLTFKCEKGHKLTAGTSKPGMFKRMGDALGMGQAVVYSKNLTSNLQLGYCQVRGGYSVPITDL